jgi:hypothetical protein
MVKVESKEELEKYMIYLRQEFDELSKTSDRTIEANAAREVCIDMFDGLTYGINQFKLEWLAKTIQIYKNNKNKQ